MAGQEYSTPALIPQSQLSSASNLAGIRFGRLLVVTLVGKDRHGHKLWLCRCACAIEKTHTAHNLISGRAQSCGCLKAEQTRDLAKSKTKDFIGKRFGRLVILSFIDEKRDNKLWWLCQCDCGNTKEYDTSRLTSNHVVSCGCALEETKEQFFKKTHGASQELSPLSRTWRIWKGIRVRCLNENHHSFENYGARGISLSPRWDDFENFLEDMGIAPEGLSIDRYPDKNGPYSPENCRWATKEQQANNSRSNIMLSYNGEELTLIQWSRKLSIPYGTIKKRYHRWGAVDAVLTAPIRGKAFKDLGNACTQ